MATTVTAVSGTEREADVYDICLTEIDGPEEGPFGQRFKFVWTYEDGDDKWAWMPAKWGSVNKPSMLRQAVYALIGGRLKNFLDEIIARDPGKIDLDWFISWHARGALEEQAPKPGAPATEYPRMRFSAYQFSREYRDEQQAAFLKLCEDALPPALYQSALSKVGMAPAVAMAGSGSKKLAFDDL